MVARLKLESVPRRANVPQRRSGARMESTERVILRSSHGDSGEARLRNASTFGCALQCDAPWLRTGLFVEIVLNDEWKVGGILRWVRGGTAGAEFLRPINQDDAALLSGGE